MPETQTQTGRLAWRERPDNGSRGLVIIGGAKNRWLNQPARQLAPDLRKLYENEPPKLAGIEVDFEMPGGQLKRVRRRGEQWLEPVDPNRFANPYTFVPALPRPAASSLPPEAADLADRTPTGHERLADELWTGQIGVRMTAATPLLLLDTAGAVTDSKGHSTYSPSLRDGKVHLPSTAVKGMLRAAYEAVTNSRFGIFTGHGAPLGHRMNASAGLEMVPARVGDDDRSLELLTGTAPLGQRRGPTAVMHAAWLPAYPPSHREVPIPADELRDQHGKRMSVRLRLVQHHSWKWDAKKKMVTHVADFRYWRVTAIAPDGELPAPPSDALTAATVRFDGRSWHEVLSCTHDAVGWVSVTNQSFIRKHDERVFFGTPIRRELTDQLRISWTNLINDYRGAHRDDDIWSRGDKRNAKPYEWLSGDPGGTAWSRHQYTEGADVLAAGDLCYAQLDARDEVKGLYPVMIARELFTASPLDLLHSSLCPADRFDALSPADRVFGWVNQRGPAGADRDGRTGRPESTSREQASGRRPRAAYGGQLRVGPVAFSAPDGDDGLDRFAGRGVPLAILSQPKPQQGRFYLAAGPADAPTPLPKGTPRSDWYTPGQWLRGRKTYPHHAGLVPRYWSDPQEDRTQVADDRGRYQEYRRPHQPPEGEQFTAARDAFAIGTTERQEQRDNQNRSVTAWIRPGGEFRFTLDVRNLSGLELGALLWLLRRPADEYHRIGLGKPLGFGSVHLDIDGETTHLRRGDDWRRHYADFTAELPGENPDIAALTESFEAAVDTAWPGAPQLAAFSAAAKGDLTVSVHYPRVRPPELDAGITVPPDPRGQSFQWFVENEREGAKTFVNTLSLPLAGEGFLPIHPGSKSKDGEKNSRTRGRAGQASRDAASDHRQGSDRRGGPPPATNRGSGPRPGPPRSPR